MIRNELKRIGSQLGINCGGVGGTPGPCKGAIVKHAFTGETGRVIEDAGDDKKVKVKWRIHGGTSRDHVSHLIVKKPAAGQSK